jgi:hypothetical protein
LRLLAPSLNKQRAEKGFELPAGNPQQPRRRAFGFFGRGPDLDLSSADRQNRGKGFSISAGRGRLVAARKQKM